MRLVALLRGVNVGGRNPVPMRQLQEVFAEAGLQQVQTYIQSGNVVFEPGSNESLSALSASLQDRIFQRFAVRSPVLLRTTAEMEQIVESNPFLQAGAPPDSLHVYFLAKRPSTEELAKLDLHRSAPDSFNAHDQQIYLQLPNGMGRTKLTNAYFDAKLSTISSARNWRTVLKLFELMQS